MLLAVLFYVICGIVILVALTMMEKARSTFQCTLWAIVIVVAIMAILYFKWHYAHTASIEELVRWNFWMK